MTADLWASAFNVAETHVRPETLRQQQMAGPAVLVGSY